MTTVVPPQVPPNQGETVDDPSVTNEQVTVWDPAGESGTEYVRPEPGPVLLETTAAISEESIRAAQEEQARAEKDGGGS